ncbi:MAG: repair protein [Gemmatimonadetes bacterium]|nr:repair protein [Gemmatimonadota bacterium]
MPLDARASASTDVRLDRAVDGGIQHASRDPYDGRMKTILTIGHSTRPIDEFLGLLRENGVDLLVDVRRFPGSRRHPQYGSDALARSLADASIDYRHEPDLGGRRAEKRGPDDAPSPNAAWRNPQFRAYADHMDAPEFLAAVARVLAHARTRAVALMCAEAVPWRCHRGLIADLLVARGLAVADVIGPGRAEPHVLSAHALILPGGRVAYPGPQAPQGELFGG